MKRFVPFLAALALMLASTGGLIGLTHIFANQIRGDVNSSTGSLLATLPNSTAVAWIKAGTNLSISGGALNAATSTGPTWADEVPGGTIDGTNATFTLGFAPLVNSQTIFRNGIALSVANGDYTITCSGATCNPSITFLAGSIPQPAQGGQPADFIEAKYQH